MPPSPRDRPAQGSLSREIFRHLPSGVVVFDTAGRVEEANPAACGALGFDSPAGLSFTELFRGAVLLAAEGGARGESAAAVLEATLHGGGSLRRQTIDYLTPQGESRRLGMTAFPLETGAASGLVCLLTDLTDIYAMEAELRRRESLSALGEMAAGIAHEFKNTLATISGYAQMLLTGVPAGEPRTQVGKILEQVTALSNIATEFLVFARPLSVQPEPVELGPLLVNCRESLQVGDHARIVVDIEGHFPPVAGDAGLLVYAFINLLRNSWEAIEESGRGSRIRVRGGTHDHGQVRLLFEDDGPGVLPDTADKIFIPFFTTKSSGTGLGLAMVHKIVTAHHGGVRLTESVPGHTVFTVTLPAAANPPRATSPPPATSPPRTTNPVLG